MILCGYVNLHDKTREALDKYARDVEYVDMSGDDFNYWRAIKHRWTGREDLLVIEQDIEIESSTIPHFEACAESWCTSPYPVPRVSEFGRLDPSPLPLPPGGYGDLLGCTRYRKELQSRVPFSQLAAEPHHWQTLDARIYQGLKVSGAEPHIHDPVKHHHDYAIFSEAHDDGLVATLDLAGNITLAKPDGEVVFPRQIKEEVI